MKKVLAGLVLFGVVGWWVWTLGRAAPFISPVPSPSPVGERTYAKSMLGLSLNEEKLTAFTQEGANYRMMWAIIDDPSQIQVGVNTDLASTSTSIHDEENCRLLTSAAFYGKDDKPIGMLVANGETLSSWQQNQLFNGILGWDGSTLTIQPDVKPALVWAVQAGPIVWRNSQPVALTLKNDQLARRILAGITDDDKLVIVVIVAQDSLFSGPMLVQVPPIIEKIQAIVGTTFVSVINLDGGTASAFVTKDFALKELKPIGSWICTQ